jgi:cystathionine gamma-lyase
MYQLTQKWRTHLGYGLKKKFNFSQDDCYGGTGRLLRSAKEKMGYSLDFVDFTKDTWEKSVKKETRIVWVETPTNPTLKVVDIKAVGDILKAKYPNVIYIVDNTFMSPILQKPLTLGADIVVHSVTKYINGHSDVVMGVTATNSDVLAKELRYIQNAYGIVPSPFDCFLAIRGVKTLHLRMRESSTNAMKVAEFLEKSDKVEKVIYPGLKSHPQYEIFKKQTFGNSGMITFYLKGGEKQSRQFLENVKIFTLAESLGGVESLAECPSLMTHGSVPPEMRKELGIEDNMIRLSCGVEDGDDILDDVKYALDCVKN